MTINADCPILSSTPLASPEQCARLILSRPHGEYTEHDIKTVIVPAYFHQCALVRVEPVLLIAQMIHETGNLTSWWSQRPRRNPAGIGVTGRKLAEPPAQGSWQWDANEQLWREGVAFASWQDDSIPAHVGRMLAYALRDTDADTPQLECITQALSYRPLRRYRGEAPTLRGLNGRWAVPGHTYADKIAAIANAICSS